FESLWCFGLPGFYLSGFFIPGNKGFWTSTTGRCTYLQNFQHSLFFVFVEISGKGFPLIEHLLCCSYQAVDFNRKCSFAFIQYSRLKFQGTHAASANEAKHFNRIHAVLWPTLLCQPKVD